MRKKVSQKLTKKTGSKKKLLQEALAEIEELRVGDVWGIQLGYLLGLLGSESADFYAYCYNNAEDKSQKFSLGTVDSFGPDNTKELLGFLKCKGFHEAEELFFKAGYYLRAKDRAEWLEFFQSLCQSHFLNHEIDRELLEVALAGCQRFKDAAEFYCHSIFSINKIIEWATGLYLKKYKISDHLYSRKILKDHIYTQFGSESALESALFAPFISKLGSKCKQWGYYAGDGNEDKIELSSKVRAALELLGIKQSSKDRLPPREVLKKNYYARLKKYHPDLHKRGNEATRRLIEAYALVLSAYTYFE